MRWKFKQILLVSLKSVNNFTNPVLHLPLMRNNNQLFMVGPKLGSRGPSFISTESWPELLRRKPPSTSGQYLKHTNCQGPCIFHYFLCVPRRTMAVFLVGTVNRPEILKKIFFHYNARTHF